MALAVDFLDGRVVGVFVRNEESGLDVASVRILALAVEHVLVEFDVVVVDGVVEGDHDHLRHLFRFQFARHFRSRFRTEAIRQQADGRIASRSSVRIRIQICRFANNQFIHLFIHLFNSIQFIQFTARVFVGSVGTVGHSVTEEAALDASAVVTGQHSFLAERLVGGQDRLDFALLLLDQTVFHLLFPVARLLLNVESQTGWTTDGLQSLYIRPQLEFFQFSLVCQFFYLRRRCIG